MDLPSARFFKEKSGATDPVGGSPLPGASAEVSAVCPPAAAALACGGRVLRFPTSSNAVIPTTRHKTMMTLRFTRNSSPGELVQPGQVAGQDGKTAHQNQNSEDH